MTPTSVTSEVDLAVLPMDTTSELPTLIGGRYEVDLTVPIGGGGMAEVYRGKDLRTRRDVAIKTLRPEYRGDGETRARFRREARLMAFLAHPNVVRVYDFIEDRGTSWVVLEYVPGHSLKEELIEHGPFSIDETADILDQVASALDHLHRRGLVHLDVKPQNLLVDPSGRLKLIDFGLAQHAGNTQEVINGATFGTAAYLSPEQASGDPVELSTDVYALGCVIYELLTEHPPFEPSGPNDGKNDVIRAHLEQAPRPPSQVRPDLALPRWLDDVVLWALEKNPATRYEDAAAFARLFRGGANGEVFTSSATTASLPLVDLPVDPRPTAPPASAAPRPRPGVGSAIYRFGGRVARRSRPVGAILWRLTAIVVVADLLLAMMLFVSQGRVPGLYEPPVGLSVGSNAVVAVEELVVRDRPSTDGAAIGMAQLGEPVRIEHNAVDANGERWWPVSVDKNGADLTGFVWSGGLEGGERQTPLAWMRDKLGF